MRNPASTPSHRITPGLVTLHKNQSRHHHPPNTRRRRSYSFFLQSSGPPASYYRQMKNSLHPNAKKDRRNSRQTRKSRKKFRHRSPCCKKGTTKIPVHRVRPKTFKASNSCLSPPLIKQLLKKKIPCYLKNLCLCVLNRPLPFVIPSFYTRSVTCHTPHTPTCVEDSVEVGGLKMVSMVSSNGMQDG